jgi:hypothetical protein
MRTRLVPPLLAAVVLGACGGGGSTAAGPSPIPASTTSAPVLIGTMTDAYRRASTALCGLPVFELPEVGPLRGVAVAYWRRGLCEGQPAVDDVDRIAPEMDLYARAGLRARTALLTSPPDCAAVAATPAQPYCP